MSARVEAHDCVDRGVRRDSVLAGHVLLLARPRLIHSSCAFETVGSCFVRAAVPIQNTGHGLPVPIARESRLQNLNRSAKSERATAAASPEATASTGSSGSPTHEPRHGHGCTLIMRRTRFAANAAVTTVCHVWDYALQQCPAFRKKR